MFLRLFNPKDPEFQLLDLPMLIMPTLYDRYLVAAWGRTGDPKFAHAHVMVIGFRWFPMVLWQYFPRAWGMKQPAPLVDASDWTGRERELSSLLWPFEFRHWTAARLRTLCDVRTIRAFADEMGEALISDRVFPAFTPTRDYFNTTKEIRFTTLEPIRFPLAEELVTEFNWWSDHEPTQ